MPQAPRAQASRRRATGTWPVERVIAIRNSLAERYRLAVDLGVGCGMRQGEIFGLSVDDLDFGDSGSGWLQVQRQVKIVRNRLVFGLPKNDKDRRIPVSAELGKHLQAHMTRTPPLKVTLPSEVPGGEPTTVLLIMTTPRRNAIKRQTFDAKAWRPALRRVGLVPDRSLGMHALRHLYASTLLDAGESIKALAEFLGHSDPAFTLRRYAHLMPTTEHRSRAAVDKLLQKISNL
ncbi:site-specific integrase [Hamadaea sp. NPDC050747]|uniref:tyrosine-type recombinase/integrase n=1 Tax=Hamadaea sp. NPDC050747 TaxID=3155789 RepID=UPI0034071A05